MSSSEAKNIEPSSEMVDEKDELLQNEPLYIDLANEHLKLQSMLEEPLENLNETSKEPKNDNESNKKLVKNKVFAKISTYFYRIVNNHKIEREKREYYENNTKY